MSERHQRTRIDNGLQEASAHEIAEAARRLLDALKASRTPYRQTARNAPSAEQVRASKRQRLAEAENRLRDLLEGNDG